MRQLGEDLGGVGRVAAAQNLGRARVIRAAPDRHVAAGVEQAAGQGRLAEPLTCHEAEVSVVAVGLAGQTIEAGLGTAETGHHAQCQAVFQHAVDAQKGAGGAAVQIVQVADAVNLGILAVALQPETGGARCQVQRGVQLRAGDAADQGALTRQGTGGGGVKLPERVLKAAEALVSPSITTLL